MFDFASFLRQRRCDDGGCNTTILDRLPKLSLVTIAVRLYSATTEKERIHFHRIHEPSGERVRYQNVVPGLGPVDSGEIVKGYEYQKGRYVTVEPDDLEKLRLETTDTIDIAEFVDADAVDPVYVDNPITSSRTAVSPKTGIA